MKYREEGPIILAGDFNGQIGVSQGEATEIGRRLWEKESPAEGWERSSDDQTRNQFGESLIRLLHVSGVTVLNGTKKFPLTNGLTFNAAIGGSVVDLVLASRDGRDRVNGFSLLPFQPESDHRPIWFSITGFGAQNRKKRHITKGVKLVPSFRGAYEDLVQTRLKRGDDYPTVVQVVVKTAREVFPCQEQVRQSWFDRQCKEARQKALLAPADQRHKAFRDYKNLVRGRKRRFLRQLQSELAEELRRYPQSFWIRLKPARVTSELCKSKLKDYIKSLYFIPNVEGMPAPVGAVCTFEESEVAEALGGMKMGAAADLDGVSLELIRWGGAPPIDAFKFQDSPIVECSTYKYLGLEITSDLRWKHCLKSRIAAGFRALHYERHAGAVGTLTSVDGRIAGVCRKPLGQTSHFVMI
ncbi:hypothetical protein R1sor_017832 [Riccia sorocarpa]|uniref:Endonuclease/exonuclease/phosphatase domain-containing protein n=1 Tax=Riccia sorocarpa TaxID=122646 RepID=A0ABD3I7Y3_9MARC